MSAPVITGCVSGQSCAHTLGVAAISKDDKRIQRKNRWNICFEFVEVFALICYTQMYDKSFTQKVAYNQKATDKNITKSLNQQN